MHHQTIENKKNMKRTIFYLLAATLTITGLSSCGNKVNEVTAQADSTTLALEADTTTNTVTEDNAKKSFSMPCTHEEVMRAWNICFGDREAKLKKYALYDVDKDGIAEVFLSNKDEKEFEEHGDCSAIFTCHNGKLQLVEQTNGITAGCSDYYIRINTKHNCIVYTHTNQGNSEHYVFFFKNSHLSKALAKITEIHWVGEGENAIDTYTDKYYDYKILPDGSIDYLERTEIKEEDITTFLNEKDLLDLSKAGTEWIDYNK